MLRLNHSLVVRELSDGINAVRMSAVFDEVSKSGHIKCKNAQRFAIQNNLLTLNGTQHYLSEPIDMSADPEDLIEYFEARFNSAQPDMFIEPPHSKGGNQIPVLISEVRWEYSDMPWRAIDKAGTIAYFERRPVLDKAGFWVAVAEGVIPKYGKSLCIADGYKDSLHNINSHNKE